MVTIVQIPISGAYTKILYEFEPSFGVPVGGIIPQLMNAENTFAITRLLGHGISVGTWSRDNNVKSIIGINNVEPSTTIDGRFTGSISVEFDAIADISWMKAIMGQEVVVSSTAVNSHKMYTKHITPPSMSMLILLSNDSESQEIGQAFLLTGVIVTSASFSCDAGGDKPLHVSLECVYQTEYKFENVQEIPIVNSPTDQPFNFSMMNAYFWNPNTDVAAQDSFDSIECIIDKLDFSIKHEAELLTGIGKRIARDKYFKNIEYSMSINAVFKDPKKFLERFYGCVNTPGKVISPYERISIVIENFERDQKHAKIVFAFDNVKIKSDGMPLQVDQVLMENLDLLPIRCGIDVWRGQPAEATVYISPSVVEAGKSLYLSGANFAPNESITITSTLISGSPVTIPANCLGELNYQILTTTSTSAAPYTVTIQSGTSMTTSKVLNVVVNAVGGVQAYFNVDTNVFKPSISTSVVANGYGFGNAQSVTLSVEKFNYTTNNWETDSSTTGWSGSFNSSSGGNFNITKSVNFAGGAGKYRLKASTSSLVASYVVYVPTATASLSGSNKILTVNGDYFPPNANVTLNYIYNTSSLLPLGTIAVSANGWLPGPGTSDNFVYSRSSAFDITETNGVRLVIGGVNGGTFQMTDVTI